MTSEARTRSRGLSQPKKLASLDESISPTTTKITLESPQAAGTKTLKITLTVETTPEHAVHRQPSLFPKYNYDDTINDLELENLLGTPYTCEVVQAKKNAKKNAKKKATRASKKIEKKEEENSAPNPTATATDSPPIPAAAAPLEEEQQDGTALCIEGTDLVAIMESMSLGKPSSPPSTNTTNENISNLASKAKSGLFANGIPAPQGSHIYFEDDSSDDDDGDKESSIEAKHRVYLRGLPQPTGTHTTFK